jgi:hypothetical protein
MLAPSDTAASRKGLTRNWQPGSDLLSHVSRESSQFSQKIRDWRNGNENKKQKGEEII